MRRFLALVTVIAISACSSSGEEPASTTSTSLESTTTSVASTTMTTPSPDFGVSSAGFDAGGPIPVEFTCDGADVNPPLDVIGIPAGTQSLVIIVDDPDAPVGTWDHWVEFDIVAGPGSFQVPRDTPSLGVQGVNSWNLEGYMGPCPPQGDGPHTYVFKVYAVNGLLGLPAGVDSEAVTSAMEGRVLASVELTGTYSR